MLIGFTSGKGAPGASVAVVNVGVALAAGGGSVVAVDLDPAGGVLSAYLGGDPTAGLWPLVRAGRQAVPDELMGQVQVLHGLPLVGGFPRASDTAGIDLEAIVKAAAGLAEVVLVDAGRLPGPGAQVLEACDRIVVVVGADPVGILAAEQALVALSQAAAGRVALLVTGTSDAGELAQVRDILGAPVLGGIPWDPGELRRRRRDQSPLTGRAARAFRRVADALVPGRQGAGSPQHGVKGLLADGT